MEQAQIEFGESAETRRRVFTAEWRETTVEKRAGLVLLKSLQSLAIPEFKQGMEVPDTPRTLRYCISSDRLDRYGDHVFQAGMDTTDYHNVVLWGHNIWAQNPPIARTLKLWTETRGDSAYSFADATYAGEDENYELAETCYRLAKNGFMPDASIGMNPKENGYKLQTDSTGKAMPGGGYDFSAWDLLEWSNVPIGANMDAQQQRAFKEFLASGQINVEPLREWVVCGLDTMGGDDPQIPVSKAKLERIFKLCGFQRGAAILDLAMPDLEKAVTAKVLSFQKAAAVEVKGICAYHKSDVTDGHWDEAKETEGGDPEQWKKQFCGWSGDGTARADYYLGHHNKDGSVPKAAIEDALARLDQVKGISDKQRTAAKDHLEHHGRDGGMKFKDDEKSAAPTKELSADELILLAFGTTDTPSGNPSEFNYSTLLSELATAG